MLRGLEIFCDLVVDCGLLVGRHALVVSDVRVLGEDNRPLNRAVIAERLAAGVRNRRHFSCRHDHRDCSRIHQRTVLHRSAEAALADLRSYLTKKQNLVSQVETFKRLGNSHDSSGV